MSSSLTVETFHLHGLDIRTESDTPAVTEMLRETLRYKGAVHSEGAASPDLTLMFLTEAPAQSVPEDARLYGRSEHGNVQVWHRGEQMYLRCNRSVTHIDFETRVARATLSDAMTGPSETRRDPLFYFITMALVVLLRTQERYALHTAALRRKEGGLLLVAESDSGKSTTALNLVRSGWQYVSDDTVLLRPASEAVYADSFRRDFCLDPEAADLFPELAGRDWPASPSDATKWRVSLEQVYPSQFAKTCCPQAIVLPSIESSATSALAPMPRRTMLGHLMQQGGLTLVPGTQATQRYLDVLRQLVTQARTYRLRAGRDLIRDSEAASTLLAPVLSSEAQSAPPG